MAGHCLELFAQVERVRAGCQQSVAEGGGDLIADPCL
jgi:hypothetical protein